jgi:hypothetical protein
MSALTHQPRVSTLLRDYTDALAQQMFYWGRDVIHPSGNLLVAHGFDRRKSEGLEGTSCYRKELNEGYIELHGACAGWYPDDTEEPGFLYIRTRRRCFLYDGVEPPAPGFYNEELLRTTPGADLLERSQRFLAWWLDYERWLAGVTGADYRTACYRTFAKLPKSTPWLPPEAGLDWLCSFRNDPMKAGRPKRQSRKQRSHLKVL